jgi:hypothetical protein
MFDGQRRHGEMARVAGDEGCSRPHGGRRDQTIGLAQSRSLPGEGASPFSRELPFPAPEWSDPQPVEEAPKRGSLTWSNTPDQLFYVYGTHIWRFTGAPQRQYAPARRPPSEHIDEDGGVGENRHPQPTRRSSPRR